MLPFKVGDISPPMNDYKAMATVFFRVLGVSDLLYSLLYLIYGVFLNLSEGPSQMILTTLWAGTYALLGVLLIGLSRSLGSLVGRGLNQPSVPPPPPPPFG